MPHGLHSNPAKSHLSQSSSPSPPSYPQISLQNSHLRLYTPAFDQPSDTSHRARVSSCASTLAHYTHPRPHFHKKKHESYPHTPNLSIHTQKSTIKSPLPSKIRRCVPPSHLARCARPSAALPVCTGRLWRATGTLGDRGAGRGCIHMDRPSHLFSVLLCRSI